jgi:hypothetical protein
MEETVKTWGPLGISLLALLLSFLSYRATKRNEKRTITESKPIASATVREIEGEDGWFVFEIKIENRSSHGYRGDRINLGWLTKAKALSFSQAHDSNFYNEMIIKRPLPLSEATRSLPVSFEISRGEISGKPHPRSVNDTHYETMYVHIPRRWFYRFIARLFSTFVWRPWKDSKRPRKSGFGGNCLTAAKKPVMVRVEYSEPTKKTR